MFYHFNQRLNMHQNSSELIMELTLSAFFITMLPVFLRRLACLFVFSEVKIFFSQ
jgi:hypothetical protein